jgi:hypothetical protein
MANQQDGRMPDEDVDRICEGLREALGRVGVRLPSLGVDLVTYADPTAPPLVELGRCNLATARRLTAALGSDAQDGRTERTR